MCLGALAHERSHGFAIAKRLAPEGDLGRVWSLSRPLTYRALDTLMGQGMVRAVASARSQSGPSRVVLGLTAKGRRSLDAWLREPVTHLRDIRSELLVKLVLCERLGVDTRALVAAELAIFEPLHARLVERLQQERIDGAGDQAIDPVSIWRRENSGAAIRFLHSLQEDK